MIKPDYYNANGLDVISYIQITQGKEAAVEFCRGNVLKYVTRFDKKNGEEDLLKAITYIERIAEIKYRKMTDSIKVAGNFAPVVNGIREINGYTLYKCTYECSCGDVGRRYVKLEDDTTTCHKCGTVLKLQPSTDNEAHDKDFNYFKAYPEVQDEQTQQTASPDGNA